MRIGTTVEGSDSLQLLRKLLIFKGNVINTSSLTTIEDVLASKFQFTTQRCLVLLFQWWMFLHAPRLSSIT